LAVALAKEMGIATIAMTGINGGELKTLCECIFIPSADIARIQESHITIGHILCGLVEESFFAST
jgi:D-sedoheptulose 7-phosphate isomerase